MMKPSVLKLQHCLVLELSVGLSFDQKQTEGKNGGHVPSTDWTNQGEFEFSFWASLCADDAALPLSSREGLLAATNAIHKHLRLFGLHHLKFVRIPSFHPLKAFHISHPT